VPGPPKRCRTVAVAAAFATPAALAFAAAFALAVVLAAAAALPSPAAAGAVWAFDGIPLTRAPGAQSAPLLVSDSAGGAVALWRDDRVRTGDVAVQRVSAAGALLGPGDGTLVSAGPLPCFGAAVVADGEGGAFAAWPVATDAASCGLLVRHVLDHGALDPAGPDPFDAGHAVAMPRMLRSASGDLFVAWPHDSSNVFSAHLARLTPELARSAGWPAEGAALDRGSRSEVPVAVASDTSGGVFVLCAGYAGDVEDLVLHHVAASGGAAAGFPDSGVIVRRGAGQSTDYALVSDGAGGAIVSWWDNSHGAGNADIFAQRIAGAGAVAPGWPSGGVVVCAASGDQANPAMVADGAGGAVIVWQDLGPYDLFAQRLTAAGQRVSGWAADGVAVCTAPGIQFLHVVAPDGAGGVFVAWSDGRSGNGDIYAQHVTGSGTIAAAWPPQGLTVCDDPADQVEPAIVGDGGSGAIIAWTDDRNLPSTGPDVYAAAVSTFGGVRSDAPATLSLLPPRPNPGSDLFRIDLDVASPTVMAAWLDIVDLAGRRVRQLYAGRPGPGRVTLWWDGRDDDGRAVHPGLYFAVAQATTDLGAKPRQSRRIVVVR
jgi:hypothetical protein